VKKKTPVCDCEVIHEDVVRRVRKVMPREEDFYDLADLYKMFADSTKSASFGRFFVRKCAFATLRYCWA